MPQQQLRRHSVCPHDCPSACALDVTVEEGRVTSIRGAEEHPYVRGAICAKVARYKERVHHPDRLGVPLRRHGPKSGSADFRPISWDDALDIVAEAFLAAESRHGAESVWPYIYGGSMGLVQSTAIERLRYTKGYSGQKRTICTPLSDAGWIAGVGVKLGVDLVEVAESDLIVVWGTNPVNTQVQFMSLAARAKRERGAKRVVVDPYRTATAEKADIHLMPKPGTDGALACAVMNVLLAEGFADTDYLARYTDFDAEMAAHLAGRTPRWAAGITGIDEDSIIAFARLYGERKRSYIRVGSGMSRSGNGAAQVHAVSCLPAVTGAWRHPGGGAFYVSSATFFPVDRLAFNGADHQKPGVRTLDMSRMGAVLTGSGRDLGDGPPVTAMLIQSSNPATVCPEAALVRRGLQREDLFVCVHEQFMTETAALADIVLPATTFLEHDDLYVSFGHTCLSVARAVLPRHAETRSNHDVVSALAGRVGAEHPNFVLTEQELIGAALARSTLPKDGVLEERWVDLAKSFEETHFLNGFGHPDGRFRFRPQWQGEGLPPRPDHVTPNHPATARHPFRMVAAPSREFLNSTFSETPTSRFKQRRPELRIHPDDAAALGLAADDVAVLANDLAEVQIHVRPFDGVQRGVVVVEGVWPNVDFLGGVGVNALISAEPGKPAGGAAFHDTAISISARSSTAVPSREEVSG